MRRIKSADRLQRSEIFRFCVRDFGERFIFHDARARHVAFARKQFRASARRLAAARDNAATYCADEFCAMLLPDRHHRFLDLEQRLPSLLRSTRCVPVSSSRCFQRFIDFTQDAARRSSHNRSGFRDERAFRPVGEARRFIDRQSQNLIDQRFIAGRFAVTADHGRDLRIENRRGQCVHLMIENFHILPAGMKHFEHVAYWQAVRKRGLRSRPFGQRINRGGFVVHRPSESGIARRNRFFHA